ncbi:MAG: cupin domain-containing protein [Sporichthyaceae bacterium]
MNLPIKRVVTGVDAQGTSIFYSDAAAEPETLAMMPGAEFFRLWGTDDAPRSPVTDPQPANHTFFPGPKGSRFALLRFPPETAPDPNTPAPDADAITAMAAEAEEKFPGLLGVFEPDAPGMHATRTLDYAIVIEGELWLTLDNEASVVLPAGSCVVQNGARHAWNNRGTSPATLAYVIIDAGCQGERR